MVDFYVVRNTDRKKILKYITILKCKDRRIYFISQITK